MDENGEGFQDYDYPDISIDEAELTEGTTTLHVSMTGDERLFQAAKMVRRRSTGLSVSIRMEKTLILKATTRSLW